MGTHGYTQPICKKQILNKHEFKQKQVQKLKTYIHFLSGYHRQLIRFARFRDN